MRPKINLPIQGLRGLSIFLVFLSHWYAGLSSTGLYPAAEDPLRVAWFNLGKYGVELFFMISGFVIIKSLRRHGEVTAFAIDRLARIYPLFAFLHVLVFCAGPVVGHKFFAGVGFGQWLYLFAVNLLMLPGIFDLPLAQLVAWSLSYEVFFYLMAAAAYVLFRQSPSRLGFWLKVIWMLVAGLTLFYHPRMCFFLPGVASAIVGERLALLVGRVPALLIPGCLLVFLGLWSVLGFAGGADLAAVWGGGRWNGVYFLGSIFAGSVFFWHVALKRSFFAGWLSSRPMVFLGDISYSFYLWHLFVVVGLRPIFRLYVIPHTGQTVGFCLFGLIAFPVAVGIAWISRGLLEVRAGELMRTWLHPSERPNST